MSCRDLCAAALLFTASTHLAAEAPLPLPAGVPDYTGVTIDNFWADGRYQATNPYGDYVMPAIDPSQAIVVSPSCTDPAGTKTIQGNAFLGFSEYGLRLFQLEGMTCDGNVYLPANPDAPPVRVTPTPEDETSLSLEGWQQRGYGKGSRVYSGPAPVIPPRVLVEALASGSQRRPPR